jgi:PAS domain S-box-containing protein
LVSGLFLALTETHNPFTPLLTGLLALMFASAVRQRYRTPFYRLLRHPLAAALLVSLPFAALVMVSGFFQVNGDLAVRLDYAITKTWPFILARCLELVLAAILAEGILLARIRLWQRPAILLPSPSESSLQTRFAYTTLPLLLLLIFTLIIADWLVAGNAAREMLRKQLSSTARVASDSLPYFMEAGQNLILNLATPALVETPASELQDTLAERLRWVPYFRQLYLFDAQGNPLGGYPEDDLAALQPVKEEQVGVNLALKGIGIQSYVVPPQKDEKTAQISFLALIQDEQGRSLGVLLGRTDLDSNPFTQAAIQALEDMKALDGEGMVLDENNRMLFGPDPSLLMQNYLGEVPDSAQFFDDTSSQGTRQMVYAQPVPGRAWNVVLTVPAQRVQQVALNIAVPLLLILIAVSTLVFFLMRLSLRGLTSSLQTLGVEAARISQGELSHALNISGEDEVGRLGTAFERMRLGLKARLEELHRLLLVSQGVAGSLEVGDAVRPILDAMLRDGASSARIVLRHDVTLDTNPGEIVSYGLGDAAEAYAFLDQQIYDAVRGQETLLIPNTARSRRLTFRPGKNNPLALMAQALYHENNHYGVLWVAHDQPYAFTDEEVRFFVTLAAQAALAAGNASLYATAEVGRQRLEAVLSSTPEPVLVTDENGCLLLLNPAALQVPGLVSSSMPGKPIKEITAVPALQELLATSFENRQTSQEVPLQNGRVYFASLSTVTAEGKPVGRVCILRDITHYKELDTLKSDFVATVSHDLRAPLTLMRGYATMLQMVGELNEQQKSYLRKINLGVENMTRLVNNLLDLGRIEAGIDLQLEKVQYRDIVDAVMSSAQPQAAQKNITLLQDIPAQPVVVEGDAALLQQALFNLVENAIKYTPVGGQVHLHLHARPGNVLVMVQDTGIGIAPLDLPRLFEKFFRSGRREAYQQRGTGMGLAIVKSIAERHGGKVWVESTLGKGSSFYMEIPLLQPQHAAASAE